MIRSTCCSLLAGRIPHALQAGEPEQREAHTLWRARVYSRGRVDVYAILGEPQNSNELQQLYLTSAVQQCRKSGSDMLRSARAYLPRAGSCLAVSWFAALRKLLPMAKLQRVELGHKPGFASTLIQWQCCVHR